MDSNSDLPQRLLGNDECLMVITKDKGLLVKTRNSKGQWRKVFGHSRLSTFPVRGDDYLLQMLYQITKKIDQYKYLLNVVPENTEYVCNLKQSIYEDMEMFFFKTW